MADASNDLLDVTAGNFEAAVIEESFRRPVLVDFWADWCAPCRMMAPQFAAAARDLEPDLRLLKLDTEASPGAGARFGIRGIPTMILFDQGREAARQSGAMSSGDIIAWVRSSPL